MTAGQVVSAADISAGKLEVHPGRQRQRRRLRQLHLPGAGRRRHRQRRRRPRSSRANTITIDVTPVNDAPAGDDNTVTTNEDTAYTFAAADFGFSDPNDTPANSAGGGQDHHPADARVR